MTVNNKFTDGFFAYIGGFSPLPMVEIDILFFAIHGDDFIKDNFINIPNEKIFSVVKTLYLPKWEKMMLNDFMGVSEKIVKTEKILLDGVDTISNDSTKINGITGYNSQDFTDSEKESNIDSGEKKSNEMRDLNSTTNITRVKDIKLIQDSFNFNLTRVIFEDVKNLLLNNIYIGGF